MQKRRRMWGWVFVAPAVHWTFDFCTDSTGYELCDQFS